MRRMNLLYLSSSSYSGSTLLAFVMNSHPDIFTISEMEGWPYDQQDGFQCSCGSFLEQCPFFQYVEAEFHAADLEFRYNDFGTAYRLASNNTLNRYLTGKLPLIANTKMEGVRDKVVRLIPGFRDKIRLANKKNQVFLDAAFKYSGAKMFLDATKNPFRLRHLMRIPGLNIAALYLVRDIHGVAFSNMRKRGWSAEKAAKTWIRDQRNILRILGELPLYYTVKYEDLCADTGAVLDGICNYLGLKPGVFSGTMTEAEHHILGNVMRLQNTGQIQADERWRGEMSAADMEKIACIALRYAESHEQRPESNMIRRYIG